MGTKKGLSVAGKTGIKKTGTVGRAVDSRDHDDAYLINQTRVQKAPVDQAATTQHDIFQALIFH